MPIELRLTALAVIVFSAGAVVVVGAAHDTLLALALGGLAVAMAGLLPAAPPMVHGVVAVVAGSILAATAVATGSFGLVPLLCAPLCVAALRLGWRPAAWALALAFIGAAALNPLSLAQPIITIMAIGGAT